MVNHVIELKDTPESVTVVKDTTLKPTVDVMEKQLKGNGDDNIW